MNSSSEQSSVMRRLPAAGGRSEVEMGGTGRGLRRRRGSREELLPSDGRYFIQGATLTDPPTGARQQGTRRRAHPAMDHI